MTTRLKELAGHLIRPGLLPVAFAVLLLRLRTDRLRAARARGDRGAISIELALAIIALVVVAGAVVAAIVALQRRVTTQVDQQAPGGTVNT